MTRRVAISDTPVNILAGLAGFQRYSVELVRGSLSTSDEIAKYIEHPDAPDVSTIDYPHSLQEGEMREIWWTRADDTGAQDGGVWMWLPAGVTGILAITPALPVWAGESS